MALALELCDLTRHFDISQGLWKEKRQFTAVNGVSLRIQAGEVLGLVGESGCGKSTLSKMILGLLQPSEGNVLIHGKEIDLSKRMALARMIQPVFQDPYSSLNPRKRIKDIIRLPLLLHKIGTKSDQKRQVVDIARKVGLPDRLLEMFPGQLSGGQRQRVAIARALILHPRILICDEPTSALDVSVQAQILNLLMQLKQEFGLTYLFISHNLAVVEYLSDRVAVMNQGCIVEQGTREQIFEHPQHPYTQTLLASILTPDPDLSLPDLESFAWSKAG
ncbi:ATP-binding cassette domain-containing protein [Celerinatantimonas diazotrophica]|uniref:Peptide/nickel transport system ATP-binding protein n=1 Tax=Celerinatantimonas diazotrophica TaxID=412034 RepID=A0A4R1K4G6_9GAMM|nr:ATP-binding cassette domain-containing protein [Celerinatantimonas diazotrophica]TCK58623.1 peptide/nickel transport system ATP-binding protein [Celerinatantimonas diazotrophica]CAG9297252.1 Oligopeptide transport ATP-binding protein OppF [Celerinatantimonas diazotrophica]